MYRHVHSHAYIDTLSRRQLVRSAVANRKQVAEKKKEPANAPYASVDVTAGCWGWWQYYCGGFEKRMLDRAAAVLYQSLTMLNLNHRELGTPTHVTHAHHASKAHTHARMLTRRI